ncbi:hypothetical protein PFFVO_00019 [Plasmodium falciparum Vietnam Oak-Knoll (FVO)]|uniref:Uncharacterized protein n=1 Tax=Plasmodium falciparum Vietnam Oak-Knoll (FVO) TaxID=1036723 RepID=A0A024VDA8_PLAFA|nr:hypothetical protein PFFVO_00019 [Plasmodium falciparum Vietnam Oak-Knoll (FVO)]
MQKNVQQKKKIHIYENNPHNILNKFRNDSQAYQFYHHNINQSNKYLLIRSFKISLHNMCLSRHILYFY